MDTKNGKEYKAFAAVSLQVLHNLPPHGDFLLRNELRVQLMRERRLEQNCRMHTRVLYTLYDLCYGLCCKGVYPPGGLCGQGVDNPSRSPIDSALPLLAVQYGTAIDYQVYHICDVVYNIRHRQTIVVLSQKSPNIRRAMLYTRYVCRCTSQGIMKPKRASTPGHGSHR